MKTLTFLQIASLVQRDIPVKPSDFSWGKSGLPKLTKNNKIHKEGFDAGYKKGYKDGLKNVSGWSKEYEKMMLENL